MDILHQKKLRLKKTRIYLQKREIQVLELICEGMSNEEVAEELFISERTVIGHKSKLIAKTGCRNTVQTCFLCLKKKN